jgi:hypothetical protein
MKNLSPSRLSSREFCKFVNALTLEPNNHAEAILHKTTTSQVPQRGLLHLHHHLLQQHQATAPDDVKAGPSTRSAGTANVSPQVIVRPHNPSLY